VVSGSDLLGVIVAVYDNQPYAHMMPISDVFSGIQSILTENLIRPSIRVLDYQEMFDQGQDEGGHLPDRLASNNLEDTQSVEPDNRLTPRTSSSDNNLSTPDLSTAVPPAASTPDLKSVPALSLLLPMWLMIGVIAFVSSHRATTNFVPGKHALRTNRMHPLSHLLCRLSLTRTIR
jgi:hypothetical protein